MYKLKNDANDYTFCKHLIKFKYKTILINLYICCILKLYRINNIVRIFYVW